MNESMVEYQSRRRLDLANGAPPATGCKPGEVWNFTTPIVTSKKMQAYHDRVAQDKAKRAEAKAKRKAAEARRRPLPEWRKLQIEARAKLFAALSELGSLGFTKSEAARALNIYPERVATLVKGRGVTFAKHGDRDTPLEAAVRAAYAEGGIGRAAVAAQFQTSVNVISVVAGRLGVSQIGRPQRFKLGFAVPPELAEDYEILKTKGGYKAAEAARILGLIPS